MDAEISSLSHSRLRNADHPVISLTSLGKLDAGGLSP